MVDFGEMIFVFFFHFSFCNNENEINKFNRESSHSMIMMIVEEFRFYIRNSYYYNRTSCPTKRSHTKPAQLEKQTRKRHICTKSFSNPKYCHWIRNEMKRNKKWKKTLIANDGEWKTTPLDPWHTRLLCYVQKDFSRSLSLIEFNGFFSNFKHVHKIMNFISKLVHKALKHLHSKSLTTHQLITRQPTQIQ